MRTRHQRRKPSAKIRDGAEEKKKAAPKRPNAYGRDAFEFNVDSINFKSVNKRASSGSGATSQQLKKKKASSSSHSKSKYPPTQTGSKGRTEKPKTTSKPKPKNTPKGDNASQQKMFFVQYPTKSSLVVSRAQGVGTINSATNNLSQQGKMGLRCGQKAASETAKIQDGASSGSQRLRKQKTMSGCPCCPRTMGSTHSHLLLKSGLVNNKEVKITSSSAKPSAPLKKLNATSTQSSAFPRMNLLPSRKRSDLESKDSGRKYQPSLKKAKVDYESDSDCVIIEVKGPVVDDRGKNRAMKKKKICMPPVVNIDKELNREVSHPSEILSQEQFLSIYGLVSKSVLETNRSATPENPCKLHRSPGGKLRRLKTHKFISKFTSRKLHLDPAKVVSPVAVLNKNRGHLGHMSKDILRLYDTHCGNKMPVVKLNKVPRGMTGNVYSNATSSSVCDAVVSCDKSSPKSRIITRGGGFVHYTYPNCSTIGVHEQFRERKTPPLECDETLSDTESPGEKNGIKKTGYSMFRISDSTVTCIQGEGAEEKEEQNSENPERLEVLSLTCSEEMIKESDESYGQDDSCNREIITPEPFNTKESCISDKDHLCEEEGSREDKSEPNQLVDFSNLLHALAPENSLILQFSDLGKDDKKSFNVVNDANASNDFREAVSLSNGGYETDCQAEPQSKTVPEGDKVCFEGLSFHTENNISIEIVQELDIDKSAAKNCNITVEAENLYTFGECVTSAILEVNDFVPTKECVSSVALTLTTDQNVKDDNGAEVEMEFDCEVEANKNCTIENETDVGQASCDVTQVIVSGDSVVSVEEEFMEYNTIKSYGAVEGAECYIVKDMNSENSNGLLNNMVKIANEENEERSTSTCQTIDPASKILECRHDEQNGEVMGDMSEMKNGERQVAEVRSEFKEEKKGEIGDGLVLKVEKSDSTDFTTILDTAEQLKEEISQNAVLALKETLIHNIVEHGLSEGLIPLCGGETVVNETSESRVEIKVEDQIMNTEIVDTKSDSCIEQTDCQESIYAASSNDPVQQEVEPTPSGSMPLLTTLLTSTSESNSKLTTITDSLVEKLSALSDEATPDYPSLRCLYNILPHETLDIDLPIEYEDEISTRSRPPTPDHDLVPTSFSPQVGKRHEMASILTSEEVVTAPEVYREGDEVEAGPSIVDQVGHNGTELSTEASKSPAMMKVIFRSMRNPWICGQTSLDVNDVNMPRACRVPHICDVCWVNDHAYCRNMKRGSAALGSCLHNFKPCEHFTYDSLKKTIDVIEFKGATRQLPNILRRNKKDK